MEFQQLYFVLQVYPIIINFNNLFILSIDQILQNPLKHSLNCKNILPNLAVPSKDNNKFPAFISLYLKIIINF